MSTPVLAVFGDTHFGSSVALAPAEFRLADGGCYMASPFQRDLLRFWTEYWDFVDTVRGGAPYILIHNGDLVDGIHHRSTQHVDANLAFQQKMAEMVLGPRVRAAQAYYQIAGTAAHVGEGASHEETVARALGAVPDSNGRHARQHLYVKFGEERISFAHHIGTTTSAAYKSSPLMRLMAAAYADAGENGVTPPTLWVRSHCHDYTEVRRSKGTVITVPAWQGKSDWLWSKDTVSWPPFGGLVIKQGEGGRAWVRTFLRHVDREEPITL